MNARHWHEAQAKRATLAHAQKLEAWVQHTRAVARDVRPVHGDQVAAALERAAAEIAAQRRWLDERFENAPNDPQGLARLLLTAELWAFDRVRDVMRAGKDFRSPGKDAGRTRLLEPSIAALHDIDGPTVDSDAALKHRVRRLRVRSGQEDALVVDFLAASQNGWRPPTWRFKNDRSLQPASN
jgi:hypothetical protein